MRFDLPLVVGFCAVTAVSGCDNPSSPDDDDPFPIDSAAITVVGHGVVQERFTGEVAARGNHAYTTTWNFRGATPGNAIKVWDTTGDDPQLVDSLIVADARTIGDVQISEDGRWLVAATEGMNGSIVVYDLTNPAHPQLVARHSSTNTSGSGVHTVKLGEIDGELYAFLSVNPSGLRQGTLVVVSLNDPGNPREVLVEEIGIPVLHDVFVRDGVLFTAIWQGGMIIWDIGGAGRGGTPASPVQISSIKTVGSVTSSLPYVHNMWWFHNPEGNEKKYVFIGEEAPGVQGAFFSGDVHVVDISNIDQPKEVAFFHVPGAGSHNFTMDEDSGILYAAFYNGGVRAIDVRGDLGSCAENQRSADGRCDLGKMGRGVAAALHDIGQVQIWGVARVGSFLYASDMLSGIFKLDVSELMR